MKVINSYVVIVFLSVVLNSSTLFSQIIQEFKVDFKSALKDGFSETDLQELHSNYFDLFTPQYNVTDNEDKLVKDFTIHYPLLKFKESRLYKKNILQLLNSKNQHQRVFAYMLISASGDTTIESQLISKLKIETSNANSIWVSSALMFTQTKQIPLLFDYLVNHKSVRDSYYSTLFFTLDKDLLKEMAYRKIYSENKTAKSLAISILTVVSGDDKTKNLLFQALKDSDKSIKHQVIYAIKKLRIPNLKKEFAPLLNNNETKRMAIETLVESPTLDDVDFIKGIIESQDIIEKEYLNAFFNSKKVENARYWLGLIKAEKNPSDYYFHVFNKPLLVSNELLPELQLTLQSITSSKTKQCLIKALKHREDSVSLSIFLNYLEHPESNVRYQTVVALKDSKSPLIINKLVGLIKNQEMRVLPITSILIDNKVNDLQSVYSKIYSEAKTSEWKNNALNYLSNFPLDQHSVIFEEELNSENSDQYSYRLASMGLANLGNNSFVERIIVLSEKIRTQGEGNCFYYLKALSKMNTIEANNYLKTFSNTKSNQILVLLKGL